MDKQRAEFEKWYKNKYPDKPFEYINGNVEYSSFHCQARWIAWQTAQSAMQLEIDLANGLLHEEQSTTAQLRDIIHGYFENKIKLEQQLSAANQRNKELEATLNQVRSTYNQIIAEDTATRNEYLDKIAKLEERIRVADAEEPVLLVVVEENDGGTLSHRISWSEANQLPLGYWPMFVHAQIPAEVELKAKIAELEAIIKASQEPRPISTAPQDDSHFIGYTRKYGWHETCWSDVQAKQRSFSKGENTWPFTYWIPCPNPVIKDQP